MGRIFDFEIDPMTQDEKEFFKAVGARIAQLRKDSSVTQVQLAQVLESVLAQASREREA